MATAELGASEWFVCELRRSNLIDRGQLDQLVGEFLKRNAHAEPQVLAEHLIQQGALSPFQAERVLANKAQGLVFGPYVLTDTLGAGSMGTVYKAVSKTDGKFYAIKVLPRRSMWNVRLARRQVRAFSQFSHPAVVPFVDVGTSGGTHYLVWPLAEGEPLDAAVERLGKLSPEQTAWIGVQVANALTACHAQNLFHGQLKPSNIMVGPDLKIAILDFGIGSLLAENEGESLVDTMSTANTLTSGLDCASPESIMEPTNRTPAGDQYSLGCILYYCATGRYPFSDGSAVEKMVAHQFKQPTALKELVADLPEALSVTVDRLMQKKPDDRFNGTDEVSDRLLPLTANRPVESGFKSGALPAGLTPRLSSFIQPPPSNGSRPLSFLLPPSIPAPSPGRSSALSGSGQHSSLPPQRKSAAGFPAAAAVAAAPAPITSPQQQTAGENRPFVMPPGYVPESSRAQFGPVAIAIVGLGAMVLSYITFLTINPFK